MNKSQALKTLAVGDYFSFSNTFAVYVVEHITTENHLTAVTYHPLGEAGNPLYTSRITRPSLTSVVKEN